MQPTASAHRLPSAESGALFLHARTATHSHCAANRVQVSLQTGPLCCSAVPLQQTVCTDTPIIQGRVTAHWAHHELAEAQLTTSLPPAETVATLARSSSRTATDSSCSSSTSPATVFSIPRVSCRGAQTSHQHLALIRQPAQGPQYIMGAMAWSPVVDVHVQLQSLPFQCSMLASNEQHQDCTSCDEATHGMKLSSQILKSAARS